ncbi:MAG: cobalamin B12-binding domain-containing protein [Desulfovibrionaceae bacterium]
MSILEPDLDQGGLITAKQYLDLLLAGQRKQASRLVLDAVQSGMDVKDVYLKVFQPAQRETGRLWQTNKISVAQEHYCTAATQLIMSQLYPYLFTGAVSEHRLVACCVGRELHEIGMRMVADFFEMEGFDTYYLGASTPDADVVKAVQEQNADLLAVSVTMPFNVDLAAGLIAAARQTPGLEGLKIMVGGPPFLLDPGLAGKVGADATAEDAARAVEAGRKLLAAA